MVQVWNILPYSDRMNYIYTHGPRFKVAHVLCSLECRCSLFVLRCVDAWNSLPDDIVSVDTIGCFKCHIHLSELLFNIIHKIVC